MEDGWFYFFLGWTHVIAEVFHIEIDIVTFNKLAAVAESLQPPLEYVRCAA